MFWVGLSAVKIEDDELNVPLAPTTRTGALIKQIEGNANSETSFYKTNLVKCLPLKGEKIRYPSKKEMIDCFPNLLSELEFLKPKIVFLLGKQVSDFTLSMYNQRCQGLDSEFNYASFQIEEVTFVPVHHPSYILVYKRRFVENYISGITSLIAKYLNRKKNQAA